MKKSILFAGILSGFSAITSVLAATCKLNGQEVPCDQLGVFGGLLGIIMGALIAFLIIGVILWIYMSFAFMAIGRKAKDSAPGLAWIPGIGPALIAFRASGMSAWPWLLLLSILIVWIPIIGLVIYIPAIIIFGVYNIIWQWKMFEKINKPGWWAILCIISPLNLIFWGIAAWSKD